MAEYKGSVSGIGVADTRENEITADNVAMFNNMVMGNDSYGAGNGVLYNCRFRAEILSTNQVRIGRGICLAYGYMGYLPEPVTFTFQLPSATQYWIVYGELNKSVVPNTFTVKVKNNQSYADIGEYTMRQDQLSTIKTGVYQEPLYLLKVTSAGIEIVEPPDVNGDREETVTTIAHSRTVTTKMTGANDAERYFGLDKSVWSVTSVNQVELYKDGGIRLYYQDKKPSELVVSAKGRIIKSIEIDTSADSTDGLTVLVNGATITPVNGTYTINASTFSIKNVGVKDTLWGFVRINSIDVTSIVSLVNPTAVMHWRGMKVLDRITRVHNAVTASGVSVEIQDGVEVVGDIIEGEYPATTAYVVAQVQAEVNK